MVYAREHGGTTIAYALDGKDVIRSERKSEYGLMVRLALFCDDDKDGLLRVFKSSGQFRDEKPNAYYIKMAEDSLKFVQNAKQTYAPTSESNGFTKGKIGINSKR